jgi:hypothetical protein
MKQRYFVKFLISIALILSVIHAKGLEVKTKSYVQDVWVEGSLVWEDQAINAKVISLNWYDAKRHCQDLKLSYYEQALETFRLPTAEELLQLEKQGLSNFNHKVCGNYWTNKKKMQGNRQEGYFVKYCIGYKLVGEYPAKMSQTVRCVKSDSKIDVSDKMPLLKIQEKIAAHMMEQQEVSTIKEKPQKPAYVPPMPLSKGEFEKTSAFKERVAQEQKRVQAYNEAQDASYAKALKRWQDAMQKQKLDYMMHKENIRLAVQKEALAQAIYLKYGDFVVQSATYDADSETFHIVIASSKVKKGEAQLGMNLLDEPVYAKNKIFSIERIEHVSKETSKVTLNFYHQPRGREMTLGQYKKVIVHYASGEKYTQEHHRDRWTLGRGDKVEIFISRQEKSSYKPGFAYMMERKNIILNNASSPALRLNMDVPVKLSFAKKFKQLLLSENFHPTVVFELADGKLHPLGIDEIKDPELLVMENAYEKSHGNEEALKHFISKYKASSLASKAQEELAGLQEQKALQIQKEIKNQKEEALRKKQRDDAIYEAYHTRKKIGDKVCMEGKILLFMTVEITGYVESVKNNKIQIRIADTKGQSPNYNGVTLRQDTIIWDDYYRWKVCE